MPNITIIRSHLFAILGKNYTDEEFDEICFEFGVEIDEITTQIIDYNITNTKEEHIVYVIAIPANRYDLLCLEGFSRAVKVFLGLIPSPIYQKLPSRRERLIVEPSTNPIRPYCAAAILRNITFTPHSYKNFIDLQDKLHYNICRKRLYVAIGTHDYDTIQGPFYYRALPPREINFIPLTEHDDLNPKSYNSEELLTYYREDPSVKHLKPYTDLIYDSPVYPVITDSNGTVLSLPPIINSRHSRIQLKTTNIFIECTGIDLTKVNIVLDTMVTMFSQYCEQPFTVEEVEISYPPGPSSASANAATGTASEDSLPLGITSDRLQITPLLSTRTVDTTVDEINNIIGIELKPEEICQLCDRMQLGPSTYTPAAAAGTTAGGGGGGVITVTIPPTRSDILHAVDVIEDIAIAYGYNKIPQALPRTLTVGGPLPINLFTDLLRAEISRAGYMEMLTHGLCSLHENFHYLNHTTNMETAVHLSNPVNIEYEIIRTTLLPGALKTLAHNKSISHKDGIRLFEISDVVVKDPVNEIGAKNQRNLIGLYSAPTSSLEIIHGLVDRIFRACQIIPKESYGLTSLSVEEFEGLKKISRDNNLCYDIQANSDPLYFPGMGGDVILRKRKEGTTEEEVIVVGTMGVIHPEVLNKFEISYPCCVVELNLEMLL